MGIFKKSDLGFVRAVGKLNYTNPFLPERIDLEREALGRDFVDEAPVYWSFTPNQHFQRRSNLVTMADRAVAIATPVRAKLIQGESATDEEIRLYDDLVLYVLFYELLDAWGSRRPLEVDLMEDHRPTWQRFSREFDRWFRIPEYRFPSAAEKHHLFSLFHQIYRAFFYIFECVIGQSLPAAQLRARIWQSIFTHDLRRFRLSLYRSLHEGTTLITGPSGSGKDLVAQAIGLSRYIPFDTKEGKFEANAEASYSAVNVSAFSTHLIESELFGHAKGAFTDATSARVGWLEACGKYGSILLDEIGELAPTTQVKLLRVLQNRQYQRIGETKVRNFEGKFIAATNRDLRLEIERGAFREDLYYRLCADVIQTPTLAVQLQDNPAVLEDLIAFITHRYAPEVQQEVANEVLQWLRSHSLVEYDWPGNIRELEQCVRNIMIHGRYEPATVSLDPLASAAPTDARSAARLLAQKFYEMEWTADEMLSHYCRLAYQRTKSFEKAAKLLQLDRRTVRAKVDGK